MSLENLNQKLLSRWLVESAVKDQLVVQAGNSRVYIHADSEEFPNEGNRYLADYSNGVELIKQILISIADRPDCFVDNDFGTALRGDEFVKRLKANPNWDWRR